MTLRTQLIRLASSRKDLRPHLLPLLRDAGVRHDPIVDAVTDARISLENARSLLQRVEQLRPEARDEARTANMHVTKALNVVNGDLTEAIKPDIIEQARGWFTS